MFKFNFSVEKDPIEDDPFENSDTPSTKNEDQKYLPIEKIGEEISQEGISTLNIMYEPIYFQNKLFILRKFDQEEKHNNKFLTKYGNCDVEPAVYEGGLTVWECTYDLMNYMMTENIVFKDKTVLDLGCGAGILGIHAAYYAEIVHFQDYNVEVLKELTIPNALETSIKAKTKFFSGDWSYFCELEAVKDVKYDYILSSEILYNPENYPKLCRIFKEKLHPEGEILLASKTYYFGVGGSTYQFKQFLDEQNTFEWKVVWEIAEGVKREIINIKIKK